MKVWIDGEIFDGRDARVSVCDHGFLYGDGVFEGIRVYGRRVFRLDDHLRRLDVSARAIGLTLPGGADHLRHVVLSTVKAFGRDEAYVRLIVSRGVGSLGVDPARCEAPTVVCIVDEVALYPPEKAAQGIDLLTVSVRRPATDVLEARVKSLNYLNSVLAISEARRNGGDEALILNREGFVAEASGANVFAVFGDRLVTPPPTEGALEGITRRTVIELASELGLEAFEHRLARIDLLAADEVFLTGTGARIVAVRSLDGNSIGRGVRGPTTAKVAAAFLDRAPTLGVAFE